MGQCGCGDYSPSFKMPGPRGIVYTISFYRACDYCETPSGIIINRMDKRSQRDFDVGDLPDAPFNAYSETEPINGDLCLAVLDPAHLRAAVEASFLGMDEEEMADKTNESIADTVVEEALNEAFIQTMGECEKRLKR